MTLKCQHCGQDAIGKGWTAMDVEASLGLGGLALMFTGFVVTVACQRGTLAAHIGGVGFGCFCIALVMCKVREGKG